MVDILPEMFSTLGVLLLQEFEFGVGLLQVVVVTGDIDLGGDQFFTWVLGYGRL